MTTEAQPTQPVAIPQPQEPLPAVPQPTFNDIAGGRNVPPPSTGVADGDALSMLHKISAEIRERADDEPVVIPIGASETIRIYQEMSAEYLVEAANSEQSTASAVRTLRAAIIEEDRPKFDAILKRPATTTGGGLKGSDILRMMEALIRYYGGRPLDGRSR